MRVTTEPPETFSTFSTFPESTVALSLGCLGSPGRGVPIPISQMGKLRGSLGNKGTSLVLTQQVRDRAGTDT